VGGILQLTTLNDVPRIRKRRRDFTPAIHIRVATGMIKVQMGIDHELYVAG
jgi:hypothetical protein